MQIISKAKYIPTTNKTTHTTNAAKLRIKNAK